MIKHKGSNGYWLLIVGIVLIGSNLRAPLTSVGSLIPFIRDDLGISNSVAGSITTLPLLAFALLSPFVPKISNRIGMEWTIFFSMLLLTVGIVIRSLFGISFLFFGTALIGLAIAVGNVLLPGFIKTNFPLRIGLMTGIYAVSMNVFASLASGLSVPFASFRGFGWEGSLGLWAAFSFVALLLWIPQIFNKGETLRVEKKALKKRGNIWRSRLAWYITAFMGIQSLLFYTLITWIPDVLHTLGYSSSGAGWLLFLMLFSIIPITFIIPVIAEKMANQKLLSVLTAIFFIVGVASLLVNIHAFVFLSMILLGVACGSAFSISMMLFSLRTKDGKQAAEMSGMAQSIGYLLAASGPVLFGMLHDLTSSWIVPLIMLIAISAILMFVGLRAGEDKIVVYRSQ